MLELHDKLYEQTEKVQIFATFRRSEDMTNPTAAAMDSRGQGLAGSIRGSSGVHSVEILQIPAEQIAAWIEEEPGLAIYRHLSR